MADERFQLNLEAHPDTRLLQTFRLDADRQAQLLELLGRYYLLERRQGKALRPVALDEALSTRVRAGQSLSVSEIMPMLPPLQGIDLLLTDDPLQIRLQDVMSRYAQHSQAESPPERERSTAVSHESARLLPGEELSSLSLPWVLETLEQAQRQQKHLLSEALARKQDLSRRKQTLGQALEHLPTWEAQFAHLQQALEQWQSGMEQDYAPREQLLSRSALALETLQKRLYESMLAGLALKEVWHQERFQTQDAFAIQLKSFEELLEQVIQQRHAVVYLQQQQQFRRLALERAQQLRQRRQDLLAQHRHLASAIAQLESLNRRLLAEDPWAVPEPTPAVALHELSRLEYELQLLEQDPALLLEDP